MKRTTLATVAACAALGSWPAAWAAEDGPTGTSRQSIVAGDTISVKRQRRLGLVTIHSNGGTCSGTLLTEHWVLTADHCVTTNGDRGGPDQPFDKLRVTASWSARTAGPTRYVRFWNSHSLDAALIFFGAGNLGRVDRKDIHDTQINTNTTLTKVGQGLCSFASEGPPAEPAAGRCGYRAAAFTPVLVDKYRINITPNGEGQIAIKGDSGGADFVTADDGSLAIAGVQSTCHDVQYVPGKEKVWEWATAIGYCASAPLVAIRDDINRAVAQTPGIAAETKINPRAMYTNPAVEAAKPLDNVEAAPPPPAVKRRPIP